MKYLNLIRKTGFIDYILITNISTCSLFPKELSFGLILVILKHIYYKYSPNIIHNIFNNKEYLLIIVNILNYFNIVNKSNYNILVLLFLIFIYLDKLLTKIELGSKLIISNFILNEIINDGKYLSENFTTGNAVELFIIQSLFLLNTILLIVKYQKNLLDYIMIILGLLPFYLIFVNFLNLWYHFVQCLYLFFCTKTIFFFFYWFFILGCFSIIDNIYVPKMYLKKIIKRKIYHFLGFIVLVPGIMFLDKTILKLILMIVSYLFIVVEILRNIDIFKNYEIIQNLNSFMKKRIDERDSDNFIVTHLFLMTGLISSLYYNNFKYHIYDYLSVIILSVGDSMCSICGVSFGKNKIYSLNNRTLEGSLGGLISTLIVFIILKGSFISGKELIQFVLIFLYEGYTLEIDNLVLPLFANNLFLNSELLQNNIYKFLNV